MSNQLSTSQQKAISHTLNPAGMLGQKTFGSLTRNQGTSFYSIFGKPSSDTPDILSEIPPT